MMAENIFNTLLKKIIETAKANKNSISQTEIDTILNGFELSENENEKLDEELTKNNIDVTFDDDNKQLEEYGNTSGSYGDSYLSKLINSFPRIKEDELLELIKKGREGDEESKDLVINSNLRLVSYVAKKYRNRGLSDDDLFQEGCNGLMKAYEKFDFTKNFKFSTYAVYWIKAYILKAINESKTITVPRTFLNEYALISKATGVLSNKLGRNPTNEEISTYLGGKYSPDKIMDIKTTMNNLNPSSLDSAVDEEGTVSVSDLIPDNRYDSPEQYADKKLIDEKLLNYINSLDEREKTIVIRRLGLFNNPPITQEELGKQLNISGERVRQIFEKTIKKIQNEFPELKNDLSYYLD